MVYGEVYYITTLKLVSHLCLFSFHLVNRLTVCCFKISPINNDSPRFYDYNIYKISFMRKGGLETNGELCSMK